MAEQATELLRSFIAIPLPEQLQRQLAALQQQLKAAVQELKPARSENLHLTLHFLGDQPQQLLAEIGHFMLSIGERKNIFNVELKGLGCFPNRRRPRVLWLGLEPRDQLIELHSELSENLQQLGVEVDRRPFRPHLTLGRFKRPPRSTEPMCPFLSQECGKLQVDRVILFSSRLTRSGAIHEPLTTARFGGNEN